MAGQENPAPGMEDDLRTAKGRVEGQKCSIKEGKKISGLEEEEKNVGMDTVDRAMACEFLKVSGRKHVSVVRRGKDWILGKGLGEAVENEEEVFAGKLDDECKTLVELVGNKNIQTRVVGGVLLANRMDAQSVGSWEMT